MKLGWDLSGGQVKGVPQLFVVAWFSWLCFVTPCSTGRGCSLLVDRRRERSQELQAPGALLAWNFRRTHTLHVLFCGNCWPLTESLTSISYLRYWSWWVPLWWLFCFNHTEMKMELGYWDSHVWFTRGMFGSLDGCFDLITSFAS